MRPMFGTLAVLKWLSGWLNFPARCRVKGRVCDAERGAGREAGWCGAAAAAAAAAALAACTRSRARAERTLNMAAMLVTSDVSKLLSVWLNTNATCRVTTQGEGVQCGASAGREAEELLGASVAAQSGVHGEGPTQGSWGAGHERTENMEPMFVTLEVSKMLSGWSN